MEFLITIIYSIVVGLAFGSVYAYIGASFAKKNQWNRFIWGLIINVLIGINFELFTRPYIVELFK